MSENMPQNPQTQDDLLETLLAGAAERAAAKATEEKLAKGTVTKSEFGSALSEFEQRLLAKFDAVLGDKLQKAAPAEESEGESEQPVQKAGRKGTLTSTTDPRSENPVRYLVQKGKKGEAFDDQDKALVWALTLKGFTQGMDTRDIDGPDFGDEYQ